MARRRKNRLISDINVVPYIDVMLVLLVVFIVTAPLLSQGYPVRLPAVAAKPIKINKKDQLVVSITADGKYYYDSGSGSKQVSLPELRGYLSDTFKDKDVPDVFIKGDERVAYGKIMELMQVMQNAGISDVGLVSQPPSK